MKKIILVGLFVFVASICFGQSPKAPIGLAYVNLQKSMQKKEVVKQDTTKKKVTPVNKPSVPPGHPCNPSPAFDHSKDKKQCDDKNKNKTCKHGKTSGCCDKNKKVEEKKLK